MGTFVVIKNAIIDFIIQLKPNGLEQALMSIGAVAGMAISIALGGVDKMIYALLALCVIDYATGTVAALKTGQWGSKEGFIGLLRKTVIFSVVALANLIDIAIDVHALRQMAICAYALNEAGSIIENIDRAGWGSIIPNIFRKALVQLNERAERGPLKK
jgi:toxin secretion/phage lysis holin